MSFEIPWHLLFILTLATALIFTWKIGRQQKELERLQEQLSRQHCKQCGYAATTLEELQGQALQQ